MTPHALKITEEINAPIQEVWDALINPKKIKQYLFGTETHCDWKVGSPIKFTGEWEGKTYEDKGTILAIVKEKLLCYNYWSSFSGVVDEQENYLIVTFHLEISGSRTQLTLSQENIQSEQAKIHSVESWKMVLGGLRKLVEKS
jgi:uncharacterized protein YndB with AHSA1/START domain